MEMYRERMRWADERNLKTLPSDFIGDNGIATARNIIREALRVSERPVVFSSFGKDSLVMLSLVQEQYPGVEVVHLMDANFMHKNLHAVATAALLGVKMHTYPPTMVDYIQREDYFEVLHFHYVNGIDYYCLYNGCAPYEADKPYLCAIADLLDVPTVPSYSFRWDCIFHGQKEVESIHTVDKYIIQEPITPFGHGVMAAPLFNWTDEEVLAYAYTHRLPVQLDRYDGNPSGERMGDSRDIMNNDVVPTCHDCLDLKNEGREVLCPKIGKKVPYRGKTKEQHDGVMAFLTGRATYLKEVPNA